MMEDLVLSMKEEWRMMTSYFHSKKLFFIFPLVLVFVGGLLGFLIPFVEDTFDMREIVISFHLLLGLYGLLVGGFGFFAEEVAQRWFGEAGLLLNMHHVLPISFRRLFVWFYLKDILYYLFLTVYPLLLGGFLAFTIPFPIFVRGFLSLTLAFLVGVSVTFLISTLYVQTKAALIALVVVVVYLVQVPFEDFPPLKFFLERDFLSLVTSFLLFVIFSGISLTMAKPVEKRGKKQFTKTRLFHHLDPLLAKEITDVKRSGTYRIIATSYLFPLLFMYGIFTFSGRLLHVPLDIPLVFYAGFIGYLGTLVYSWLHNIDSPSFMGLLPVTGSQVIRKKIHLFLAFSLGMAFVYLGVLGYVLHDFGALPLSVFSMGCTTFYVAVITAYLCGLYPNSRLFEGSILAPYLGAILPVLVLLSILSLMRAYLEIFMLSLCVMVISLFMYKRLDRKYQEMHF